MKCLLTIGIVLCVLAKNVCALAQSPCDEWTAFPGSQENYAEVFGPVGDSLIVTGRFRPAPGDPRTEVLVWDGAKLRELPGIYGIVLAAVEYEGRLIVGGQLKIDPASEDYVNVAMLDGDTWKRMGSFASNYGSSVSEITVSNGKLFAAGLFTQYANWPRYTVAEWDGKDWNSIGIFDQPIYCSTSYKDQLVVGGRFTSVGGKAVSRIASWNGEAWFDLPGRPVDPLADVEYVRDFTVWNGRLVAAWDWYYRDARIGAWDGARWSLLASSPPYNGFNSRVLALASNGPRLFAAGEAWLGDSPYDDVRLLEWTGGQWRAVGARRDYFSTLAVLGDSLYSTSFKRIGGTEIVWTPERMRIRECIADYDCDGVVAFNDVSSYLTDYFARSPNANIDPYPSLNIRDLFYFITVYVTSCN